MRFRMKIKLMAIKWHMSVDHNRLGAEKKTGKRGKVDFYV